MGNFYKKMFFKKNKPSGEKRENPLKRAPKAMIAFGRTLLAIAPRGLEKIKFLFIHSMQVQEGPPLSKFKTYKVII